MLEFEFKTMKKNIKAHQKFVMLCLIIQRLHLHIAGLMLIQYHFVEPCQPIGTFFQEMFRLN